jgi:hypothetical protein
MGSAAMYGSARLVRVVDELFDARAQLAQLAIAAERARVARDLHDVLGQSLTAMSLKGELAVRLLKSDTSASHAKPAGSNPSVDSHDRDTPAPPPFDPNPVGTAIEWTAAPLAS